MGLFHYFSKFLHSSLFQFTFCMHNLTYLCFSFENATQRKKNLSSNHPIQASLQQDYWVLYPLDETDPNGSSSRDLAEEQKIIRKNFWASIKWQQHRWPISRAGSLANFFTNFLKFPNPDTDFAPTLTLQSPSSTSSSSLTDSIEPSQQRESISGRSRMALIWASIRFILLFKP